MSLVISVGLFDQCTLYFRREFSGTPAERAQGSLLIERARTADIVCRPFAADDLAQFLHGCAGVHLPFGAAPEQVVETLKTAIRHGDVVAVPVRSYRGASVHGGGGEPPRETIRTSKFASVRRAAAAVPAFSNDFWADWPIRDRGTGTFVQRVAQPFESSEPGYSAKDLVAYLQEVLGKATPLGDAEPFEFGATKLDGEILELTGRLTPNTGAPGSWYTNPGSGQMRLFGANGKPVVDFDFDHNHGQGTPHAHNWEDVGGDYPARGYGVPFSPWP